MANSAKLGKIEASEITLKLTKKELLALVLVSIDKIIDAIPLSLDRDEASNGILDLTGFQLVHTREYRTLMDDDDTDTATHDITGYTGFTISLLDRTVAEEQIAERQAKLASSALPAEIIDAVLADVSVMEEIKP